MCGSWVWWNEGREGKRYPRGANHNWISWREIWLSDYSLTSNLREQTSVLLVVIRRGDRRQSKESAEVLNTAVLFSSCLCGRRLGDSQSDWLSRREATRAHRFSVSVSGRQHFFLLTFSPVHCVLQSSPVFLSAVSAVEREKFERVPESAVRAVEGTHTTRWVAHKSDGGSCCCCFCSLFTWEERGKESRQLSTTTSQLAGNVVKLRLKEQQCYTHLQFAVWSTCLAVVISGKKKLELSGLDATPTTTMLLRHHQTSFCFLVVGAVNS